MSFRNLGELFRERSQTFAHLNRWRTRRNGEWLTCTNAEHQRHVYQLMAGFQALGLQKGDRVGIMSNTSVDWVESDWALVCSGAVPVSIYPSLLADTVAFIAQDADLKFLLIENREQYDKLQKVRSQLEHIERVIIFDGHDLPSDDPWILSLTSLRRMASNDVTAQEVFATTCAQQIEPEDLATIVYTSGTTGNPKGAMLAHRALLGELTAIRTTMAMKSGDDDVLFLPAAHIFGRLQHMCGVDNGLNTAIIESIKQVLEDVQTIKPTFFFSVPRMYEKIFSAAQARAEASPIRKRIFAWALNIARQNSRYKGQKAAIPASFKLKYGLADRLVLKKVRALLGGNIRYAITGGAPLDIEILEFFNGAGVLLLEGWGLTETSAAVTANRPDDYRLGTVGKVFPGNEIKIAADGEVLVRGNLVLSGYYNNQQKTDEALIDGWFYTGDIGKIDADGFLSIVDRKKDLLITASGKNIAPQAVEAAFKNSPYISQCAVFGDRRPYLVALFTLDIEAVTAWANREHVTVDANLHKHPKLVAAIEHEVQTINPSLPSFEQIKAYEILPEDFTIENDLLTPTLKIRRRQIYDRFAKTFEQLYKR